MISDTLHKEGKPQDVVAESLAVRRVLDHSILMAFCTNNSDGYSLNGYCQENQFKNLGDFTKSGLRLVSVRLQESSYNFSIPNIESLLNRR